jgi:hypothetical protein
MNKTVTFFLQPNIASKSIPPDTMGSPIPPKLCSFEREDMHGCDSMVPLNSSHGPVKLTSTDRFMEVVAAIVSSEKLYDSEELTLEPNQSDLGGRSA